MTEMFESDLDEVFFDENEFATNISINDTTNNDEPEIIIGIFDSETEVIFDRAGEFADSSASIPSLLVKKIDAQKIGFKHIIIINESNYKLHSKDEENTGLIRVFLEKKR